MNGSSIWDQVLSRIETKVNRHIFYTWFKPTSFVADDGVLLRVRVPNGLFRDWLTKHYAAVLDEALGEIDRKGTAVTFVTEDVTARSRRKRSSIQSSRTFRLDSSGDHGTGEPELATRPPAAWLPATPSTPSSSAPRTSSRMPPAGRSRRRRRGPTTRCSSTAAWDSARRT